MYEEIQDHNQTFYAIITDKGGVSNVEEQALTYLKRFDGRCLKK